MRALYEETRRHFDVVAEQMPSDLRLMAEGVGARREQVVRVEHNLREDILRSERELRSGR